MKIGFFGGCFNPPTIAHIELAKKAIIECNLDKLIFVPVGDFYKKRELTSATHRYNMLKIATEGLDKIEVSDFELNIKENVFAIDIFKMLKQRHPNDDLFFIMGADNFINVMNWKEGKELIEKYKYIIFERDEIDIEGYIKANLHEFSDKIIIIKNKEYKNMSSSEFRKNTIDKVSFDKILVNDTLLRYIEDNKLFS